MTKASNKSSGAEKELFDRMIMDTRVCMVAMVQSYDPAGFATVVPMHRERTLGETGREVTFEQLQPIENVPVGDVNGVRLIPTEGTKGLLLFNDVDLDGFLESGEAYDVDSSRFHDYNDAIFIPTELSKARPDPAICIAPGTPTSIQLEEGCLILENPTAIYFNAPKIFFNGSPWDTHTHGNGNNGSPTTAPIPMPVGIKSIGKEQ